MTGFTFDAKAALKAAQGRHNHPNRPNRPNGNISKGAGLGGFGRLGTERVPNHEIAPGELAREAYQERAATRNFSERQHRADAEEMDSRMRGNAPNTSSARADGLELDPDAGAYLDRMRLDGLATYGAMASAMGWGATRAWRAEAKLCAAGLVRYHEGRAVLPEGGRHDRVSAGDCSAGAGASCLEIWARSGARAV